MRIPCATLLSLAAVAGCRRAEPPQHPNVLLICLDTVRADHLGCYGYERRDTTPRLDALAAESTHFLDASAVAGWTKPSVPTFLASTYPIQHGVYEGNAIDPAGEVSHALPQAATTVAEVFQGAGFATAAFVHNTQLARGLGFEQGFELYEDDVGTTDQIRERAQDWLAERPSGRPFLLYLHVFDAHWPWPVPVEYASRYMPAEDVESLRDRRAGEIRREINESGRRVTPEESEGMLAIYDGSLRYIDDQLAQLFAWMDARGLWQDTIVCVVSDHGEEFGEHELVGHGHGLYEALLRVPWILRIPGREPRRVGTPVSLVDLPPTLAAAAGVEPSDRWVGLDRLTHPERVVPILAEYKVAQSYSQSVRRDAHKLVRHFRQIEALSRSPGPPAARRYRAAVARADDGRLHAVAVRVSEDDPADPPAISGVVARLDAGRFELAGIPVELAAGAQLLDEQGERASPGQLAEGQRVTLSGEPTASGFLARRVAIQAAGEAVVLELNGTLEVAEGGERFRIAGQWVTLDPTTAWQGVEPQLTQPPPLMREMVLGWALREPEALRGLSLRSEHFDLDADPAELAGREQAAFGDEFGDILERRFAELARQRFWSSTDQVPLSAAEVEGLRALGY